jgi:hypothetical protein
MMMKHVNLMRIAAGGKSHHGIHLDLPAILFTVVISIFSATSVCAQVTIENAIIRLGRYQTSVANDGAQTSILGAGWTLHPGEGYWQKGFDPLSYGGIDQPVCANWTDPDGKLWKYMLVNPTQQGSSIKFPLKLSDGKYMHNYVRYPQTLVTVNGKVTSSADPRGELNPSAINVQNMTADQYVESSSLTNVGLEFRRRIYAWSHFQDNNYIVCEYIIRNIGVGWGPNQLVKLDFSTFKFTIDTVRLPVQTIQGFIFGLERLRPVTQLGSKTLQEKGWFSSYGFRKGDSLRVMYAYDGQVLGVSNPSVGEPLLGQQGRLQNYMAHFVQTLHADKAWNDKSDDVAQPRYTSYAQNWNDAKPGLWGDFATETMYKWIVDSTMSGGPFYTGPNVYPGLHQVNMDDRGYTIPVLVPNYNQYYCHSHCGPYDIPPGKEIHIVMAMGIAGLPPEFAFQVGRDWYKGTCTFNGKNSSPVPKGSSETANDYAKDQWVYSSVDSMMKTCDRAKWNIQHNFQIPVPPPPLASLTIQEQVGGVKLSWSNNAEAYPTFEGYRIYRAMGASDTTIYRLIGELSKTKGNLRTEYIDQDLDRGPDYYYYVTTFSISSGPNAYRPGEVLESGINYVEAFSPTRFVPKQGLATGHWQDSVRVVPNPFNLSAKDVQFSSTPDKIMFVNLPPVCTIRIYSENGSLIKTIEHTDGKSDEQWEQGGQYMLTDGGQRVVSGIYIAHFQTSTGESQFRKFVVVR